MHDSFNFYYLIYMNCKGNKELFFQIFYFFL